MIKALSNAYGASRLAAIIDNELAHIEYLSDKIRDLLYEHSQSVSIQGLCIDNKPVYIMLDLPDSPDITLNTAYLILLLNQNWLQTIKRYIEDNGCRGCAYEDIEDCFHLDSSDYSF